MRRAVVGACFLLGAVSASAIVLATRPPADDATGGPVGSGPRGAAIDQSAPTETASDQARRWETAILSRPLFNPDRRPSAQALAGSGEASGLPRLSGIMITPAGRHAIFASPSGGKQVVVVEGGSVGGYLVEAISPGEVMLAGSDGKHGVHPTFDNVRPAGRLAPPIADGPIVPGQEVAKGATPRETNP
jgi:hypothetical protein